MITISFYTYMKLMFNVEMEVEPVYIIIDLMFIAAILLIYALVKFGIVENKKNKEKTINSSSEMES